HDVALEVLYLEASDEVLVRRFSETRRPHPADQGGGIADGIRREREKLHGLRELADRILDTSAFTVHELRSALRDLVDRPEPGTMTIGLLSFGYKYGLPTDADLVLDARFLPNPYFVEALRDKTGSDPAVADYVLCRDETQEFLRRLVELLEFTLPRYRREGKSYLTIALGCTGGRHRSIVLVEELRRRLQESGHRVLVRHRDAER
ncbi:MAG TPA: RNase adapter RapZ, partial [Candidatus Binatus sp.]|nr:RNase adapter RapZ [Candidatus Binatus sp.]